MNIELYRLKNQEAILRSAKESGLPLVYAGSKEDNATIISAANEMLLYPQPLGNREYLVEPEAPVRENFSDEEKYNIRFQSYERVRGVFDDNIKAGMVVKVFEVSYHGNLSGEQKYLYNVTTDDNGDSNRIQQAQATRLTEVRTQLRTIEEKKQEDRVERQRAFLQDTTSYIEKPGAVDDVEDKVFFALLASRLSAPFRKTIGLDLESAKDVNESLDNLNSSKSVIMREFIRTMLSDKQVCYSQGFANLLELTMNHSYSANVAEIESDLASEYEKKLASYKKTIAELETALREAQSTTNEKQDSEEDQETLAETSEESQKYDSTSTPKEHSQNVSNEAVEPNETGGESSEPEEPKE